MFAAIPVAFSGEIRRAARLASYGWGVVPVSAAIMDLTFETSLFPRDGDYLLPLKVAVRRRVGIALGDRVAIALQIYPATAVTK